MKFSAVILTKNEQANIQQCIENVQAVAGEVLVVDDHSHDDTPDIAESLGARVLQRELARDWAAQRNFALNNVTLPWTLMLDADERLDGTASLSLEQFLPVNGIRAAGINRLNYYKNKPLHHGRFRGDVQLKVLQSNVRYNPARSVHELPMIEADEVVTLDGTIEHFTYVSLGELFRKTRLYGEIEGETGQREANYPLPLQVIRRLAHIPIQNAWRDGLPGLINVAADIYGDSIVAKRSHIAKQTEKRPEAGIALE